MGHGAERSREYNAGNNMGRTFDDGQGAKLCRPENRFPYGNTPEHLAAALIYAGIMCDEDLTVPVNPPPEVSHPDVDPDGGSQQRESEGASSAGFPMVGMDPSIVEQFGPGSRERSDEDKEAKKDEKPKATQLPADTPKKDR